MTELPKRFSGIALFGLSVVILMAKAWESTLQAMDSAVHARLALEVTRKGWLPALPMPQYWLDLNTPHFNDHPFFQFYLVGHFMRWVGPEAWSARFLPSLFGVLCVMMLFKIGKDFFSERVGFFAGLFLLVTPLFIQFSARFQLDPGMILFILLSFYAWMKGKPLLAGLAVGMAVVMKSPVGFLLLPAILIHEWGVRRDYSLQKFGQMVGVGLTSFLPPALLWGMANQLSQLPLFQEYFAAQVLGTAVSGRGAIQAYDPLFFVHHLVWKNWVWMVLFTVIAIGILKRVKAVRLKLDMSSERNAWFPLFGIAALIVIFLISALRFKFAHYYLPAFPFLALVAAVELNRVFPEAIMMKVEQYFRDAVLLLALISPLVLIVFPIHTAPEMFPALRKFAPYLQSEGTASDIVLFIKHAQPYGGDGDYYAETAFYADRKYAFSECEQANDRIRALQPKWVLTSGANEADVCLSAENRKLYSFQLKAGNQYLLGKEVRLSPTDLTPLYRELKVPVDGKPASLPSGFLYRY